MKICSFSALSGHSFMGSSWNCTPNIWNIQSTIDIRLFAINKKWSTLYVKSKVRSWRYLFFQSRENHKTPHLGRRQHTQHTENVWLRLISNEGHFTWSWIWSFIQGFPENPYLALETHNLQTTELRLQSPENEGYFTCETKSSLGSFWSFIQGIFLKLHT
jgi:hypothetical protein